MGIEKIPHKCKFAEFGCQTRKLLDQLKLHEQKCNERTVKCPVCSEVVQIKSYDEHAQSNGCVKISFKANRNLSVTMGFVFSRGYLEWDGVSKRNRDDEEFDLG